MSVVRVVLALLTLGCGAPFHRMPDRPVVWTDPDDRVYAPPPAERYVSWRGDAIDNLVLRPASSVWTLSTDTHAINVNALDEVPDSSWFEDRIGRRGMTPEEVARAACDAIEPALPRPLRVVEVKRMGTHPGLLVEDANGARYMLKTDGALQPERATAADAIGAALYHAAGYFVPCNRVVWVERGDFVLAEPEPDDTDPPLRELDVDQVLETAGRAADGRYRVGLSRFVEGTPLGPWSYAGQREDDRNDVVPHEHRRDLRALALLAAWTGHIDARQENTLSAWMDRGDGQGYVRHYLIDFGDCFGVMHEDDRMSRRLEHEHYLDLPNMAVDLLTLGFVQRAYRDAELGPAGRTFGYYPADDFVADEWTPGYPNPAFDQLTEHDGAWMARVLARFELAHLRAAVGLGRFARPETARVLVRALRERQRRILERYLVRLSPLASPTVARGRICLADLAASSGLRATRHYEAWSAAPPREALSVDAVGARVCVTPPRGVTYVAIDVVAATPGRERSAPARVHAYRGATGWRVVGLERRSREERP